MSNQAICFPKKIRRGKKLPVLPPSLRGKVGMGLFGAVRSNAGNTVVPQKLSENPKSISA